jgi:hypothetical protein
VLAGDQYEVCCVERALLEAKVVALQSRLDVIEAKAEKAGASSMALGGLDPDALETAESKK